MKDARRTATAGTARSPRALAALVSWWALQAMAAGPSGCDAEQQTLFTCTSGRKAISVCASADLSASAGAVQYRFGPPGAAELVYPAAGADWRALTRAGVLTFSGGGGSYLAFERAPYRYIVYSAIGQGWGKKAGVVVEKNGRRIANRACTGPEASVLGPEWFDKAGVIRDTGSFELP